MLLCSRSSPFLPLDFFLMTTSLLCNLEQTPSFCRTYISPYAKKKWGWAKGSFRDLPDTVSQHFQDVMGLLRVL